MIKVCLIGAAGKMGRAVIEEANNYDDIEITNFIVHKESELSLIHISEPTRPY